ncbi:hypothetical protein HYX06_05335 [Candidatus Woesearchaeota archaeon]|nr:hypothetical protein [Candidatus Woesearchaeota archaeon]
MGLEAVREEIIKSAKEQESALIAEARKEASRIMKDAESKVREIEEKSEAEAKKSIEAIKKQALASGEMESKKLQLEAKKQAIERAFEEAKKSLEIMDDRKRESMIRNLLEKAKKEIDAASVYCSKADAKLLKGIKTENIDIAGGIIAENSEATIRVDYSFDTMLGMIKDSEMQNISKLLFG